MDNEPRCPLLESPHMLADGVGWSPLLPWNPLRMRPTAVQQARLSILIEFHAPDKVSGQRKVHRRLQQLIEERTLGVRQE
jgi:hypothetical protein